ncbi:type II toxin-antitoxin system VapC family toxin [Leifsonia shinshuensis]|uniref:type II toxin-antitoxin system VapC family toxin n=1 Tax=Leifsonia shinshuensis TaxID=150026 RepID=UPI001F506ECB|nr:type II toxin-antitoxin system VapC family toxin [Leifsonia shinshuensis]MCI0156162.1 type II toxin-antitoxin system VapC family toxin [Leifsonia shinshuensis]
MLDTSVLISGIPDHIIDELGSYRSSTVCRGELMQGLFSFQADPRRKAAASQRHELIATLDDLPEFWLDFDRAASDGYGTLTARPRTAIRQKDALIAAHAYAVGVPLLTEDAGFSRFPDVEVVIVPSNRTP